MQGIFIRHPEDVRQPHPHPWTGIAQDQRFNNRSWHLPQGAGQVLFLKRFACAGRVRSLVVSATALGVFRLYLNGVRLGEDEMSPGWTDYGSRVFVFSYDGTDAVQKENCLVAEVSAGWWSGRISFGAYGFRPVSFCGEITVQYEDGTAETYPTGEDWQCAFGGRVRFADIWDGERQDARMPEPSLNPGAYSFTGAVAMPDPLPVPCAPVGPQVKVRQQLTRSPDHAVYYAGTEENGAPLGKIRISCERAGDGCEAGSLSPGTYLLLDFGQNMVGRPEITLRAPAGTTLEVRFAEMLNDTGDPSRGNDGPAGSPYLKNYRSAMALFTYTACGEGQECAVPGHVFYGFRYIEIACDGPVEIVRVRGLVLGSDLTETGEIETDHPGVNQLISNIRWGMRGNYLSVPTDCPQRDERLGWTGDTQIFCGAASYLADVDGFLRKWLGDARDSQIGEEGAYCDVIPRVFRGKSNGNAAWAEAGLIVPHRLWLMYNDLDTLREHYDSMEAYMAYLTRFGLEGPNTAYGDWLNYDVTDKRYIAVCCYAYDAQLMALFARLLGKADREEHYGQLYRQIRDHFYSRYMKEGRLLLTTQTSYLLALHYNLLLPTDRAAAVESLAGKIRDNGYRLSTGFVGTGILNQTLSEVGLDNLAYALLTCREDPSWLYSVDQGATTVWERWNSYTAATGFGDVGMNSFNHYAYGAVAEWMFAYMAGIRPDPEHPGFDRFILNPRPDSRTAEQLTDGRQPIRRVSASYHSRRGVIRSAWERRDDGSLLFRFTVPSGTVATLTIAPETAHHRLTADGQTFDLRAPYRAELAAGEYEFILS